MKQITYNDLKISEKAEMTEFFINSMAGVKTKQELLVVAQVIKAWQPDQNNRKILEQKYIKTLKEIGG